MSEAEEKEMHLLGPIKFRPIKTKQQVRGFAPQMNREIKAQDNEPPGGDQ
jgi:hypothetical protein